MWLIKNVNNVNEATGMNTKQEQQQYSKWMRFQLMQSYWAKLDGLNTNCELKSEPAKLKTNGKYMR